MWFDEDKAIEAFRTGKGVAWGEHDGRLYCGVAAFYRNAYRASLVPQWLPALDGVVEQARGRHRRGRRRLRPRPLDLLMAEAFPHSRFHGFDTHAASIEEARRNAARGGRRRRASRFDVARAADYPGRATTASSASSTACTTWATRSPRRAHAAEVLAPDGTVMLVEPFANDRVEDNISPVGAALLRGLDHDLLRPRDLRGRARWCSARRRARRGSPTCSARPGFTHFRRAAETPFNLILEVRR